MPPKRPVLLTGFEPFEGFRVNPSWEAVRVLEGGPFRCRRLPVSFRRAAGALEEALREVRPRAVVAFGVCGSDRFRLEQLALNVDHARIADNDGARPRHRPIAASAPMTLATRLPLDRIERRLERANIPASRSYHAGTYLCNHVFYLLLRRTRRPAGFIHVPPLRSRKHPKGWSLARIRRGVRAVAAEVSG